MHEIGWMARRGRLWRGPSRYTEAGEAERVLRWVAAAIGLPLVAYALQVWSWGAIAPFAWFLFYPVIFTAPRLGTFYSGLVATLLSGVMVWREFIPPVRAMVGPDEQLWLSLVLFLLMGVVFSWFHQNLHAAERAARVALSRALSAEQRKDELLATVADPVIVVNGQGLIEYANAQTMRTFGYSESELLGQGLEMLIPERLRPRHSQNFRNYFANPVTRPMEGEPQLWGQRKDGTEFPIEVNLNPFQTSHGTLVSAVLRDVSVRRRFEDAARVQSDRLAAAIDATNDPFAIYDAEGRLVQFNAAFEQLWRELKMPLSIGMQYSTLYERAAPLFAFASEAEREQFVADRERGRARGKDSYDVRFSNGRAFRAHKRVMADGSSVITAFELTAEIARQRELEEARAEADRANRAKTEFLASMSHELRTPLNAVLGFAQLLLRDKRAPLEERQASMVRQINVAGGHLLSLIDDVLDLARVEREQLRLAAEPVELAELVKLAMETLVPVAEAAGVELSEGTTSTGSVLGDRRRILQTLLNLGSNAIKYNHPGGGVTFDVAAQAGFLRVTVTDGGVGVAAEQRDQLFLPFNRAGQEAGPIPGTGIGLALTKRLIEHMGGQVGYAPRNPGSAFWIELPSAPPGAAPS